MKTKVIILLAGTLLALCGCTTDEPLFANDYTKEKTSESAAAGPSNQEQSRDIFLQQNNGAGLGTNYNGGMSGGNGGSSGPSRDMINQQAGNPYGH
jgi:hypothetical protein